MWTLMLCFDIEPLKFRFKVDATRELEKAEKN